MAREAFRCEIGGGVWVRFINWRGEVVMFLSPAELLEPMVSLQTQNYVVDPVKQRCRADV